VQHCKEKINTAYSYLGIIKRNFIYLDEDAFVMLYKSLVRSHLEYANSVWNPHRLGLIKDLEKVQMRATKLDITVWMVVQTVLTATFNSYGNRQISTPYKISTPEPIKKNFAQMITSARGPLYQIWYKSTHWGLLGK